MPDEIMDMLAEQFLLYRIAEVYSITFIYFYELNLNGKWSEFERIHKLNVYFEYHQLQQRFHITFERFVQMVENGSWKEWMAA